MFKLKCEYCGNGFKHQFSHTKTCSLECRKKRAQANYKRYSGLPDIKLPPNTMGSISELKVATQYMLMGYDVFRSLSLTSSCDLVAIKGSDVIKIEVKTGYINPDTLNISCPKKKQERYDVLAVYVASRDKIYIRKSSSEYIELCPQNKN